MADGARVVFYEGDPEEGAAVACETVLSRTLSPSTCTEAGCLWTLPDDADPRGVLVRVDPDGEVPECRSGNNDGVIPGVYCDLI